MMRSVLRVVWSMLGSLQALSESYYGFSWSGDKRVQDVVPRASRVVFQLPLIRVLICSTKQKVKVVGEE